MPTGEKTSDEQFRALIEASTDGMLVLDKEGRILYANPAAVSMLCRPIEELVGANFGMPVVSGASSEVTIPAGDDSVRTAEMRATGTRWNGAPAKLCLLRDISRRKKSEEKLRRSERRYRFLFETMTQGVVCRNADGEVLSVNPAAQSMLGPALEDLHKPNAEGSRHVVDADGHDLPPEQCPAERALRTGETIKDLILGLRDDAGEVVRWLLVSAVPEVRPGEEQPCRVWVTCEDVTDLLEARKNLEARTRALAQSRTRARNLNRVLRAIRDVNQLIVREDSREELIRQVCERLVRTRGFDGAWIVLTDDEGGSGHAGFSGVEPADLVEAVGRGDLPKCCERAREAGCAVVTENPGKNCDLCPIREDLEGALALTAPLMHGSQFYGFLGVYTPTAFADHDEEEVTIVSEIAGDLAFALHGLEVAAELKESERRYRLLAENTLDCIWLMDLDMRFTYINPAVEALFGYKPEEFVGTALREHCSEREFRKMHSIVENEVCGPPNPRGITFQTVLQDAAGNNVHVEITGKVLRDGDGNPVALQGTTRDITERYLAQETVRRERDRANRYLDVAGVIIVALDSRGRAVKLNRRGAEMLGCEEGEVLGKNWFERFIPERVRGDILDLFDDYIQGRKQPEDIVECPILTCEGEERLIAWHNVILRNDDGEITGTLSSGEDITEQREAERARESLREQLLQAQKMESVGRLAGGVAHDFNNLLTGIKGCAQFVQEELEPGTEAHQDISEVLSLSDRAAELTEQLLAFSRRQTLEPKTLNLNTLISNQAAMLRRLLGEDIDISFNPAAELEPVHVDPGQMGQVVVNLAVNARDAMPDGGKLTVETANVHLDEAYAREHANVTPGPYVMMAVSDTGCGMDEETASRIFEPFFTTKRMGRGTGLGLAMVYGIVNQHEGSIRVYSEPGEGTTFKIYLPVAAHGEVEEPHPAGTMRGGSETILVVEDEDPVRDVARRMLQNLGYEVLVADGGEQAMQVAADHEAEIDLLVADVVMPHTKGPQVYEQLVQTRPGLKVLYTSGYTDNAIVHHGVLDEGVPFLRKPFERGDLARKVRRVLDGHAQAPGAS